MFCFFKKHFNNLCYGRSLQCQIVVTVRWNAIIFTTGNKTCYILFHLINFKREKRSLIIFFKQHAPKCFTPDIAEGNAAVIAQSAHLTDNTGRPPIPIRGLFYINTVRWNMYSIFSKLFCVFVTRNCFKQMKLKEGYNNISKHKVQYFHLLKEKGTQQHLCEKVTAPLARL